MLDRDAVISAFDTEIEYLRTLALKQQEVGIDWEYTDVARRKIVFLKREVSVLPDYNVKALVDAVEAAFACGMIPKSTAAEGGANKYSEQVRVADQLRAAMEGLGK